MPFLRVGAARCTRSWKRHRIPRLTQPELANIAIKTAPITVRGCRLWLGRSCAAPIRSEFCRLVSSACRRRKPRRWRLSRDTRCTTCASDCSKLRRPLAFRQDLLGACGSQKPHVAVEQAPVVHTVVNSRFVRRQRFVHAPLEVGQVVAVHRKAPAIWDLQSRVASTKSVSWVNGLVWAARGCGSLRTAHERTGQRQRLAALSCPVRAGTAGSRTRWLAAASIPPRRQTRR